MTDIEELIERLLAPAFWFCESSEGHPGDATDIVHKAATALSAQQREIAELREALRQIAWARPLGDENMARNTRQLLVKAEKIALAALNTPSQEGEKR